MPCKPLALTIAACLLTTSCASTPPSPSPTTAPLPPPEACMAPCPTLPPLPAPRPQGDKLDAQHDKLGLKHDNLAGSLPESALLIWLHDLIDAAGTCRRQHDTCRASHPGAR